MDITDHDQYIPDKELNMNFRIPRKRAAEEPLGASADGGYPAESSQYDSNARPLTAYSGLSGAASRASAYSNSKGPVAYNRTDMSKIDTSVMPPTVSTNQNVSIGATQFLNRGIHKGEEYPKSTQGFGSTLNSNFNKTQNQQGSKFGFSWVASSSKNNYSADNKSEGSGWASVPGRNLNHAQALAENKSQESGWNNGGQERNWSIKQALTEERSQESAWNDGQTTNWDKTTDSKNQESGWNNDGQGPNWDMKQASTENKSQESGWNSGMGRNSNSARAPGANKSQEPGWKGSQASSENKSKESGWNSGQGRNLNNSQGPVLNRGQGSSWNSGLAPKWNNAQPPKWNSPQPPKWNSPQPPKWNGPQAPKWNSPPAPKWCNIQAPKWCQQAPRWNNPESPKWSNPEAPKWHIGMGRDNNPFNRDQDNDNEPGPFRKPFNWNGNGNNPGRGFNGGFRGRGGMNQRGFRNENYNHETFGRVLDDSDDQIAFGSGWKSRNFNDGRRSAGRYWNKSEKPKKPKPITPPVTIADVTDETLPKELREMFQPLFCKLCSIQMSSNVMAKMHYVSKNHEKKIRKYLIEYSEKTGEPLHSRATITAAQGKKEKEEDKDPKHFYCELCDLQLTGKQHAESHYMGKSHNAVRMGRKRPAGQGFYDESGKWIRKAKEAKLEYAEGEDTFGMDFRKTSEEKNAVEDTAPSTPMTKPQPAAKTLEQFICSICTVSCVSQDQLNIHFSGAKHKKKLKLNGVSPDNFTLPETTDQKESEVMETVEATTSNDADEALKNKYITPNGYFYCEKCNLTVNSEIQFKQHLASKNHAKKVNALKTQ